MYVLFEEDGSFKTATIIADNDTSLQVEAASGKRLKVKAANVLLRFQTPAPGELLGQAEALAADIDTPFLWECAGEGEFAFAELADEYFGDNGSKASATEAAALLFALHAAPIYFHRKGKGRFRKAPPDILAAALAGLEKKRQQALAIERMADELAAFTLPPEFPPLLDMLLYQPDRNRSETKALEAACVRTGLSPTCLLARCGAIPSPYAYHLRRFLREYFPRGVDFPAAQPEIDAVDASLAALAETLPRADVRAFSIDDAATTEIDDAFSLTPLAEGGWCVGIHIAAPGLGFAPDSPLGALARERLSTVYMPGDKITMLPNALVERFTLRQGHDCPTLSLYLTVAQDFSITAHESRIERVPVVANLRHHDLEPLFNAQMLAAGLGDFPFASELSILWQLAQACLARRGKTAAAQGDRDYSFHIEGDLADAQACHVTITERPRGSPLDTLVSELMIVANSLWGSLFADNGIAAIYRAQSAGKVRLTTAPQAHEGLGVAQYAWSSSPLRRYVDLLNQWQLIACLRGDPPPFKPKSDLLYAALRDFELTYAAYADFQRTMERYWCLRWLAQEALTTIDATVRRDELVKLDGLPLLQRIASLPALPPGSRVRLDIDASDLLTLALTCRYRETLETPSDGARQDEHDTGSTIDDPPSPEQTTWELQKPPVLLMETADI